VPEFIYTAINQSGTEIKGTIDAENEKAAREKLLAQGSTITSIKKEQELSWEEYFNRNNRKISQKDILMFTKYFAVLVKAGIPILRSLVILEKQMSNLRFKKRIKKIRDKIEAGSNLYETFGNYPDTFPPMYLNLLRIGEESGMLYDMLEKLNSFLSKSQAMKAKVKGAMIYPATIMLVGAAVLTFLMAFIIPRFSKMFASFGAKLPLPTRIVMGISDFIKGNIPLEVVGIAGIIYGIRAFLKWPVGRIIFDKITLRMPIIGGLIVRSTVQAFTSNLSTLLKAGVSISRALEITNEAIDNTIVREEMKQVKSNVESGMSIGEAIEKCPTIPDMVAQMIAVGDQTGTLENMLENIAEFYEEEVDQAVDAMTGMIEPLFIVFLGVSVGGIVISMFLPIFQMAKHVGG
jgi:type IV pilus assembly protein PilC